MGGDWSSGDTTTTSSSSTSSGYSTYGTFYGGTASTASRTRGWSWWDYALLGISAFTSPTQQRIKGWRSRWRRGGAQRKSFWDAYVRAYEALIRKDEAILERQAPRKATLGQGGFSMGLKRYFHAMPMGYVEGIVGLPLFAKTLLTNPMSIPSSMKGEMLRDPWGFFGRLAGMMIGGNIRGIRGARGTRTVPDIIESPLERAYMGGASEAILRGGTRGARARARAPSFNPTPKVVKARPTPEPRAPSPTYPLSGEVRGYEFGRGELVLDTEPMPTFKPTVRRGKGGGSGWSHPNPPLTIDAVLDLVRMERKLSSYRGERTDIIPFRAYRPYVRRALRKEPPVPEPLFVWQLERMFGKPIKPFRASVKPTDLLKTDHTLLMRRVWGESKLEPTVRFVVKGKKMPKWKLKALERERERQSLLRSGGAIEVRTKGGLIQLVKVKQKVKQRPLPIKLELKPVIEEKERTRVRFRVMPERERIKPKQRPLITKRSGVLKLDRERYKVIERPLIKEKVRVRSLSPTLILGGTTARAGVRERVSEKAKEKVALLPRIRTPVLERTAARARTKARARVRMRVSEEPLERLRIPIPSFELSVLPPRGLPVLPLMGKERRRKKRRGKRASHKEEPLIPLFLASYERITSVEMATGRKAHSYIGKGNIWLAVRMQRTGIGIPTLEELVGKTRKKRKKGGERRR